MTSHGQANDVPARYAYRYPMTSVAADVVIFHVSRQGRLELVLVKRKAQSDAYPGAWALPGGFFRSDEDESITACVLRELREEAGIGTADFGEVAPHVELVGVYSNRERDPRPERIISIAFLAVLTADKVRVRPIPDTDVVEARWFAYEAIESLDLAFDHRDIIRDARKKLAQQMSYGRKDDEYPDLLFAFLSETFTLAQAQEVMTILKGEPVDKSNFRKYIERYVIATGESVPTATRPAALFRRRSVGASEDQKFLGAGLARLQKIAEGCRIKHFDLFLSGMSSAPDDAARMLGRILSTYARHRDYSLKATRVPDLRIDDGLTDRVLLTIRWQPQKQSFLCTALAEPDQIRSLALSELRRWNTGPHKSVFRLGMTEADFNRIDDVLGRSAATLCVP